MPSTILYLGRDDTDHTVTLAINGTRWEYTLNPQACDTVEYLAKRVSAGKALAFAKSRASREVRL